MNQRQLKCYFPLMEEFRTGIHAGRPLSSTYCVALLSSMDATAPLASWQKWKESQKNLNTFLRSPSPAVHKSLPLQTKGERKLNSGWLLGCCPSTKAEEGLIICRQLTIFAIVILSNPSLKAFVLSNVWKGIKCTAAFYSSGFFHLSMTHWEPRLS